MPVPRGDFRNCNRIEIKCCTSQPPPDVLTGLGSVCFGWGVLWFCRPMRRVEARSPPVRSSRRPSAMSSNGCCRPKPTNKSGLCHLNSTLQIESPLPPPFIRAQRQSEAEVDPCLDPSGEEGRRMREGSSSIKSKWVSKQARPPVEGLGGPWPGAGSTHDFSDCVWRVGGDSRVDRSGPSKRLPAWGDRSPRAQGRWHGEKRPAAVGDLKRQSIKSTQSTQGGAAAAAPWGPKRRPSKRASC